MTVVLMYHALYRGKDTSSIDQEDLPYAVSDVAFAAQLDALQDKRVGLFGQNEQPEVVITFDDGHESNLEIAAPLLLERGLSACFFVTSGYVDRREGFMSSEQLRSLSQMPGMLIGSHGESHRFFDDMSDEEARHELLVSRESLESIIGQPCLSMSFPGGRFNQRTLTMMEKAGYRQWFGSEVGMVAESHTFDTNAGQQAGQLLSQSRLRPLERVAIRRSTSLHEFARIVGPDEVYYRQHKRRSQAKFLGRRFLGNRLYHGLYKSLSAR